MKKIFLILFPVILLDQITKGVLLSLVAGGWVLTGEAFQLVPVPYLMSRITGWFNLVFTWNPGTAFSILTDAPEWLMIFLTSAIIGFLGYNLFAKIKNNREIWAMSLIVGGAIGNLVDRIRFGAVIDFMDWHIGTIHWPAFNVADMAICLGVAMYALYFLKERKNGGKTKH